MKQHIFSFDDKKINKLKYKKFTLGGKGANLSEMGSLGLPVPPGFTISTDVCKEFYSNKKKLPSKIISNIKKELKYVMTVSINPLLGSVLNVTVCLQLKHAFQYSTARSINGNESFCRW